MIFIYVNFEDVLIQYGSSAIPYMSAKRSPWRTRPSKQKLSILNEIFFLNIKIAIVKFGCLVVEVLDSYYW